MEEKQVKKRMSRRRMGILVLLLAGLAVLLYPVISTKWNDYRSRQLASSYQKSVQEKGDAALEEMKKEADSYNQTLFVPSVPDAFSIRDGVHDPAYEALLNPSGDGVMADLQIPAIHVDLPIYHYTSDESLGKGAGHLFGSSLPVGGKGTHAVISAHRGLPGARMFTDLNLLKKGDLFYIHVLDQTLAYEVDQILTVEPDQTQSLAIDKDQDYVTLVTCTPYAVNTHRLLVRGHRVPYEEAGTQQEPGPGRVDRVRLYGQILSGAAGIAAAVLIVKLVSYFRNKKQRKDE